VLVGISAFAVEQLGDITLVNLDVKPGDKVTLARASVRSRASRR